MVNSEFKNYVLTPHTFLLKKKIIKPPHPICSPSLCSYQEKEKNGEERVSTLSWFAWEGGSGGSGGCDLLWDELNILLQGSEKHFTALHFYLQHFRLSKMYFASLICARVIVEVERVALRIQAHTQLCVDYKLPSLSAALRAVHSESKSGEFLLLLFFFY